MTDKLKIMEHAVIKVSGNNSFMAYYLFYYAQIEKKAKEDLLTILNCSLEDLYKLALCKAPDVDDEKFIDKLNTISSYTNTSTLTLNNIIKKVCAINVLRSTQGNTYLMAARDKDSTANDPETSDKNEKPDQ